MCTDRASGTVGTVDLRSEADEPVDVQPFSGDAAELAGHIRAVLHATAPADVRDVLAALTAEPGRLASVLAQRAVFEVRDGDGTLLGVAAVHLTSPDRAYLGTNMVARRGQGIGRALVEARLDWAVQAGATEAVATTHPWNVASLAMLSGAGFVESDRSPDTWIGAGELIELTRPLP